MSEPMTIRECMLEQTALHPAMAPQDMVKLCYQAAFGAEHLLADPEGAKAYFLEEYEGIQPAKGPLAEWLSENVARVNMACWKQEGLPPLWLFRLFALSKLNQAALGISQNLALAAELCSRGQLPFSLSEWAHYTTAYLRQGVHAVHHSPRYREQEKPAYRLVSGQMLRMLPLLRRLWALPEKEGAKVIAIDGRAASGKTTLAGQLASVVEAGVIHMDDFFLPLPLRTVERLKEPGGNVHYERFLQEALPKVKKTEAFEYRVFNCETGEYGEERPVVAAPFRIVEGAYSNHPMFSEYMDLRVFSDVSRQEQQRRIMHRNGPDLAALFESRWIPMEEKYFAAFSIKDKADVIL